MQRLTAKSADRYGEMLADKVDAWRIKNLHRILTRTYKLLEESQQAPTGIPARLMYPMLEAGANEDDPSLQELWSQLIYRTALEADDTRCTYIEFLRQISPSGHEV